MRTLFICLFVVIPFCFAYSQEYGAYLTRRKVENSDIKLVKFLISDYTDAEEVGEYLDGKKHGVWKTIGTDSIVYVHAEYDMGVEMGNWQMNYPDGSKRYVIKFDSLKIPVEWSRYYYSRKLVTIHRDQGITDDVLGAIIGFEATIFNKELYQYESNAVRTEDRYSRGYSYRTNEINVPGICRLFDDLVKKAPDEYHIIDYNYPSGTIANEYIAGKDAIISCKTYYYKGKKLKRVYYYEYGKLIKTETYKNGEVVKVE